MEIKIFDPVSLKLNLPIIDENETQYYPILLIKKEHLEKLKNHITKYSS